MSDVERSIEREDMAMALFNLAVDVTEHRLGDRQMPYLTVELAVLEHWGWNPAKCDHHGIPDERFGEVSCCLCRCTVPRNRVERVDRRVLPDWGGPVIRVPLPLAPTAISFREASENDPVPEALIVREYQVIGRGDGVVEAEARWVEAV